MRHSPATPPRHRGYGSARRPTSGVHRAACDARGATPRTQDSWSSRSGGGRRSRVSSGSSYDSCRSAPGRRYGASGGMRRSRALRLPSLRWRPPPSCHGRGRPRRRYPGGEPQGAAGECTPPSTRSSYGRSHTVHAQTNGAADGKSRRYPKRDDRHDTNGRRPWRPDPGMAARPPPHAQSARDNRGSGERRDADGETARRRASRNPGVSAPGDSQRPCKHRRTEVRALKAVSGRLRKSGSRPRASRPASRGRNCRPPAQCDTADSRSGREPRSPGSQRADASRDTCPHSRNLDLYKPPRQRPRRRSP